MITLTEHLILELNASTLHSAAVKAQKLGDDRAKKFMQAYLDKLAKDFDSRDTTDEQTKEINSWYKEDKHIFTKLKNTYGLDEKYGYISTFQEKTIVLPKGMDLLLQRYYLGKCNDEGKNLIVSIRPVVIGLDSTRTKTRFAFVRKDNKIIIPFIIELSQEDSEYGKSADAHYELGNDQIVFNDKEERHRFQFEKMMKSNKEFSKLVNNFLSIINPNHN